MAEILGSGFIDTVFKELVTKKLTMQGDIELGGNDLLFGAYGKIHAVSTQIRMEPNVGYFCELYRSCRFNACPADHFGNRVYGIKTVTSDPAVGDLADGEILFCNATNKRVYARMGGALYYVTLTAV